MPIEWGLARQSTPNDYLGPLQAMQAGRQAALDTRRATATQQALQQYSAGDLEGAQRTAIAGGALDIADKVREAQARGAAGQVIGLYGTPGGAPTSFAPPSPAQALITAGTPVTAPQQALAPTFQQAFSGDFTNAPLPGSAGAPSLPGAAPVGAPADRTASPLQQPVSALTDHTHDTAVQIGHAVVSGQPVEPTQAWAKLYSLDPAMGDKMMAAVGSMDKLRVSRLDETTTALANAAQSLLSVPVEQRAAEAQRLLPMLSQHGVTADMLTPQNLTDDALKGIVGQSLGVKGMLEQSNKVVEQGQNQQKIGIEQGQLAETSRHNVATEQTALVEAHKGIQDAYGNVIDPLTGNVIHDASGGTDLANPAGIAQVIAKIEGTGKNPNSSAQGYGQFTNATFIDTFKKAFPDQAGLSNSQILAKRGTGVEQNMLATLTNNNIQALGQAGVPATAPNVYLAHFLGSGAALPALKAAPDTPISHFVAANAMRANNLPANMTVGQLQDWAAKKVAAASGGSSNRLSDDAAESAAAIYVKTGQLPAGIARTKGDVDKILNKAAEMQKAVGSKPGDIAANWQDYKSQSNALKQFNSGTPGTPGATIRSLNVATDHLTVLAGAIQALNNGDVPAFNKIANALSKATGKTPTTDFASLKGFVTDEVNKAILAGNGGVSDREQAHAILEGANSPQQLYSAIGKLQRLMGGQLDGLRHQYEVSAGRTDFDKFLTPATLKALGTFFPDRSKGSSLPGGFKIIGRTAK